MGSRRRNSIVLALVALLIGLSVWTIFEKPTRQGIDLAGGTELVYQGRPTPANPTVDETDIDRAIDKVRERVDSLGVSEPEIARIGSDQLSVSLPDVQNAQEAIDQVGETSKLTFYDFSGPRDEGPNGETPGNVIPPDPGLPDANERPFNRLYDAVKRAQQEDPECLEKGGKPLCTTNGPTFYLFDEDTLEPLAGPEASEEDLFLRFPDDQQPEGSIVEETPQGYVIVRQEGLSDDPATEEDESEGPRGWFLLRDRPELSGDDIRNPEQNFDSFTQAPNVTFEFTDEGRKAFQEVTQRIAQRGAERAGLATGITAEQASQLSDSFAVILDGEVVSRPIINFVENPAGIDGRTGAQISGNFTIDQAQTLAEFLQIGALPIDLKLISQSTVSATLGQEALNSAILAGVGGVILVVLFLIFYYRFLGLVAALGLFVYALFLLAMIKALGITLTLPGIAGLILTIGVASDSNVVIFERIKEEARLGRSMLSAISQGYRKGIATIIDANVITLITAFILFVLATASVKGFAFTLGIGTLVSLFTAVLFTQAILAVLGRARFLSSPRFLGAGERRIKTDFNFTGMSKYFFSASGVILAIGAFALAEKQLNLGIDFESGTRIKASLVEPASVDEVRATLSDAGIDGIDDAEIQEIEEEGFGENVVQVQAKIPPDQAPDVQQILGDAYGLEGGEQGFQNTAIGPTFGQQIAESAVIALIFSLLVIAAYVALRFEAKYAVPIMIALVHDILLAGGAYALMGFEVNSATVAAFLTILGYSIYDCVIVFDRIRENVPRMPRAAFSQIVNRSMSEVLVRSLITGLGTVFLLTMILIFGDETLRGFALAMMLGIASGTYSSIFIAAPVLTEWKERESAYRARRHQLTETMGYVPVFPEENVVARIEGHGEKTEADPEVVAARGGPPAQTEVPADAADAATPTGAPFSAPLPDELEPADDPHAERAGGGDDAHLGDGAAGTKDGAKERKGTRQRRRRKHGRSR
ncbi:hypothetical protein BH24ACT23_BH24ACT23_01450 [soil metagenome]